MGGSKRECCYRMKVVCGRRSGSWAPTFHRFVGLYAARLTLWNISRRNRQLCTEPFTVPDIPEVRGSAGLCLLKMAANSRKDFTYFRLSGREVLLSSL